MDPLGSVLANLRVLLNARKDMAESCTTYGIPDLTNALHSIPFGTGEICEALREVISTYEPRLRNVRVEPVVDEDASIALRFEVTGRLALPGARDAVRFSTRIRPGGHVEIE